jgi:hypothetical protein
VKIFLCPRTPSPKSLGQFSVKYGMGDGGVNLILMRINSIYHLRWRWRQQVPIKRRQPPTRLHGIRTRKNTVKFLKFQISKYTQHLSCTRIKPKSVDFLNGSLYWKLVRDMKPIFHSDSERHQKEFSTWWAVYEIQREHVFSVHYIFLMRSVYLQCN